MITTPKGATAQEWAVFSLVLGLTEDLLPVVSDSAVQISPNSKMKSTGKTPSIINRQGFAAGLPDWTNYVADESDVTNWSKDSRLGICLQTRTVRAFDLDVTDAALCEKMRALIFERIGVLPMRTRPDSNKVLLLVEVEGEYTKRSFKAEHGIVEFLASGQQCIVAGTHTSGARYTWDPLPSYIPKVSAQDFEALWDELVTTFAIEPPTTSSATSKKERLNEAITTDPVAAHLTELGIVKSTERDGRLHIVCPFAAEHSAESSESATTYFPANTGGYAQGHFDCKHAHCAERTDDEFKLALGFDDLGFADYSGELSEEVDEVIPLSESRFTWETGGLFNAGAPPRWLIKGVLPHAELGVLYGASSSGKSFKMLNLAMHIVHNKPWRGHKVNQGRVAYLAAEGATGFKKRLVAYSQEFGTDIDHPDFLVSKNAINFLNRSEALAFARSLKDFKPVMVIIDTFARVTPGANENSGEDMGKALAHCQLVHQETGAMVALIHHSGKDSSKGARGWSGIRAAADWEAEVIHPNGGEVRVMTLTKQKDAEDGQEYGFKLRTVGVGIDEDGELVTSCVVDETEAGNTAQVAKLNLGKIEQLVMAAARDTVGLDGVLPDVNTVIDAAVEQMAFDQSAGKRDKRKENATRAYKKLIERGVLLEVDGRVA